jgi:SAM-dependent methyltransferase
MTSQPHASSSWTTFLRTDRSAGPLDRDLFARYMGPEGFPRATAYDPAWVHQNLMGPNALWLMEDLAAHLQLEPGMRVLDLGCGSAITSIFLAREFGAQMWAADLWIEPSWNLPRIIEAGVADSVIPIACEAHDLPFAHGYFDGVVSVDSYHYFGTDVRYLSYLAQFVRPGGFLAIVVPGNSVDPDDRPDDFSGPVEDFGADWFTFRSATWWERHWRRTKGIEVDRVEMVADGWDLWYRYMAAGAAWSGTRVDEQVDAAMLLSSAGRTMGFVRAIAHRRSGTPLVFGPGRYATRLA